MRSDVRQWSGVGTGPVVLVFLPGVAVDPSVVVDTPWLRAVAAFLIVLPFGAVVLNRYGGLVDRSIDASMDSPLVSVVYGVAAHLMILFAGGVFSTQLANAGLDRAVLSVASTAVLGALLLAMAGLGFAVLGTWLADRRGDGRPWQGFVAVAAVGSAGWLLSPLVGVGVWILVVSVGVGGPTRKWIHSERTVESEAES